MQSELKTYKYNGHLLMILIFLFPALVSLLANLFALELDFYKLKLNFAENILFSFFLLLVVNLIPWGNMRKFFFLAGYLIIILKIFFQTSYYYLYGGNISASTIFILIESNLSEAGEYLQSYFSGFNLLLIVILFLPVFLFKWVIRVLERTKALQAKHYIISAAFVLLVVFAYHNRELSNFNLYAMGWNSYNEYKKQSDLYDETGLHRNKGRFEGVYQQDSAEKQIHVLIIGESTTRHRMSLYAYDRPTNPHLTEKRDELMVFEDVISPHTHTIESLSKFMTLNNYENEDLLSRGSMIQLMNQAGFKTYWLSNQRPMGWNETLITKMAGAADESRFINSQADYLRTPFDEELIPYLEKLLQKDEQKSFIVLHLLGTHNAYSKRYPKPFEYFKGEAPLSVSRNTDDHAIINQYDNAIRYNDFVISEIIQRLKKQDVSSYLLYLSDHGEDVFQVKKAASHTETNGTYPMYDVPFVLWQSQKFRKEKQITFEPERKYMLDDLIYSISDLSGVRFKRFKPQRSIFSDSFAPRKRIIYNQQDYDSIFKQ